MRIADRIVSIVLIIAGILIVKEATTFDFFDDGTPGPGFLPLFIGVAIILVALIPLVQTFTKFASKEESPLKLGDFKPFLIYIGSGVILVLLTSVFGLLIPLGLFVGFTSWMMGTKSVKTLALLVILTPLITFALFDYILGVPLPKGFLGF
ncbi:MAG: tripartite tricarboxylate transporter TctB family protein [Desulfitobacteriia bacterium]